MEVNYQVGLYSNLACAIPYSAQKPDALAESVAFIVDMGLHVVTSNVIVHAIVANDNYRVNFSAVSGQKNNRVVLW